MVSSYISNDEVNVSSYISNGVDKFIMKYRVLIISLLYFRLSIQRQTSKDRGLQKQLKTAYYSGEFIHSPKSNPMFRDIT